MKPLLSDSLEKILSDMANKENIPIVSDILTANTIIKTINSLEEKKANDPILILDKFIDEFTIKLNNYVTDEVRCLSIRPTDATLSFLPKDKPLIYNDDGKWSRKNRQVGKPAKIFQKLLVRKYSCSELENFQNKFKACVLDVCFKIVSGKEITDCYNEKNYFSNTGTLGKSCMRYDECENYFKVYEDNAKMLVAFKENKVAGRAIIWEINGKTYMDRVYTYIDYMYDQFINYAETQEWYHRENNDLLYTDECQYWVGPENNYSKSFINSDLCISLPTHYDEFPYMDSFRYYDADTNVLYTTPHSNTVPLDNTNGQIPVLIYCDNCGCSFLASDEDEIPEDLSYCNYDGNFYCSNCCWQSSYDGQIYPNSIREVAVHFSNSIIYVPETKIEGNWEEIGGEYYALEQCVEK